MKSRVSQTMFTSPRNFTNELHHEKTGFLPILLNYCTADLCLCFCYTANTIPLLFVYKDFKLVAFSCKCIYQFVWDLVGNPKKRFSLVVAQMKHKPASFKISKKNIQASQRILVVRIETFLLPFTKEWYKTFRFFIQIFLLNHTW